MTKPSKIRDGSIQPSTAHHDPIVHGRAMLSAQLDFLIDELESASTQRQTNHDALVIAIGNINIL